jgi:hypothetical protein
MAGKVRTYPGAALVRRHRCPDCETHVRAIALVEVCPDCGQILGPSMRFERMFLPDRPKPPAVKPPEPPTDRPVADVVTQLELF